MYLPFPMMFSQSLYESTIGIGFRTITTLIVSSLRPPGALT